MSAIRKNLIRAAAALLVLALLLAAGLALAPRWINLDPVKARIAETASRAFGARLSYERLEVVLLPRPRVTLHGARLLLPGKAEGTIAKLEAAPTIVSLFRRDIRLARLNAEMPDFRVTLPAAAAGEKPLTLPEAREKAARLLSALSASVPGAVIELSRGRLTLLRDGRALHAFTDLSARIEAPPGTLRADIACGSTLWERLTAKVVLDPDGLKAKGELRVTKLAADRLSPLLPADARLAFSGAFPDLGFHFESEGFRTLRGDFKGSVPALSLRRGARRLAVRALRLSGALRLEERELELAGLRLSSDAPPLEASGAFRLALPAGRASLSFRAVRVDVKAVRDAVLAFAGDVAPFPDIFDWIRGGTLPSLDFAAQARTPYGLGTLGAITLRGTLRDGRLHVAPGNLDLEGVRGEASLAGGVLAAVRVFARLGNSSAADAAVGVSFGRKGTPFRVEAPIRADLSQIPAVMGRLPLPPDAAALFAGITSLSGSASGRLKIEGDDSSVRTSVTASAIRLAGRHRRIPLPFSVTDGTFALSGSTIRLGGHAGTVGRTKFSGMEARLRVGGDYPVDNLSGRVEADLGELSAWVASVPGADAATGGLRASGGTADLSVTRLEGPLARPEALRFEGSGTVRDLRLEGGGLPGPLSLRSGKFRVTPETLAFESFHGSLLDAELHGSGAWTGFRGGARRVEASELGGVLGPEAVRRIVELVKLPSGFSPRAPIDLSNVRFRYGDDNAAALSGTFSPRGGPVVGLDLSARPGSLEIRSASIRDDASDAAFSLARSPDAVAAHFSGRLAAASIGRLFPGRDAGDARLSGNFRVRIPRGGVLRPVASGTLEAAALRFPELLGPLEINKLSLEAAGERVSVRSADLAWNGKPFTLVGELLNGTAGLSADLDLHAEALSVEEIERELARFRPAPGVSGEPWRLPLTGRVRVTADAFTWRTFDWKPVRADVGLEPHAVTVTVKEAGLCGIGTTGTLRMTPEGNSVDFSAAASGQPIDAALACLGEKNFRMTGSYSLTAHVAGQGRGDALLGALKGAVTFEARKGRIHKANVLMKVLALLNVTQLLVGKVPDLAEDGFAYSRLGFSGTVANGRLAVPDLVLDAASANIAAQGEIDLKRKEVEGVLLASPFKTVDSIIRMIPVVRYILKGRLVAVPFRVHGDIGDPGVSILPAAEVGAGLLGVVERTLKLPVHLIEPMLPKEKAPAGAPSPP